MTATAKRTIFWILVLSTIASLVAVMTATLNKGGISGPEVVLLMCFVITLPWTAIGFWNAVIGFVLLRLSNDPAGHVFPASREITGDEEINTSTAIAMCIRNEDVSQVYRNLNAMIARLVASGCGENFHIYVLSDSFDPSITADEETQFAKLKRVWAGDIDVTYRRRENNPGFKAGNIEEFCDRWGDRHDFMLTLDADSVMSASTILRMVRLMQKNENLGIVQSLVVGLPSDSAFTRVFQFGMRMGMKSYTLGSAWWQADCGPYWGHNALIRMKPFMEHCRLPQLPGKGPLSGWVLSHDQVEAVYMRRAGYECRVLAEELGSYEENPPHILEFIRRDLRWCHGNMQYFKLLREPGLKFTSRIQLVLAIMMFIGSPAWILFVLVATGALVAPQYVPVEMQVIGPGYALFGVIMTMIFAPKIASVLDVLLRGKLRRSFGGGIAVILSAVFEIVFSMMLAPIMAIANTVFLFKLFILGKPKAWTAQTRQAEALPLALTAQRLWPQMVFGGLGLFAIAMVPKLDWVAIAMCLPVFVGPMFAIPFAISSSHPVIGRAAARLGLWQLPEEEQAPVIVRALNLPAIAQRAEASGSRERLSPLSTDELLSLGAELETVTVPARRSGRMAA